MANYEINLTATQIEAALNKAHAPATVVDSTQNLVESGAIKTYVDTQVSAGASITTESFAGSALEDSTEGLTATDTAVPTSAAVLAAITTQTQPKIATLTLPTTSYSDTRTVTGWVESDPNGYINYNANGTFSLTLDNVAKAGKYSATLVLTAFDFDGGSDAHSLRFYKNGVLMTSMTISLNNAQNTNGGVRFTSFDINQNENWYVQMYESPANTVTRLSDTSITVTKYV